MLRRHRDRLAEAELVGLEHPALRGAALDLVCREDHLDVALAHHLGQRPVERREPGARIDQKEAGIGHRHRPLGERPHPALEARIRRLLEPGGVDHLKPQRPEPGIALAQVAGHPRLIVDQREPPPDEAVEKRRLAHIGAADDGKREGHQKTFEWPRAEGPAARGLTSGRLIARR